MWVRNSFWESNPATIAFKTFLANLYWPILLCSSHTRRWEWSGSVVSWKVFLFYQYPPLLLDDKRCSVLSLWNPWIECRLVCDGITHSTALSGSPRVPRARKPEAEARGGRKKRPASQGQHDSLHRAAGWRGSECVLSLYVVHSGFRNLNRKRTELSSCLTYFLHPRLSLSVLLSI